MGTCLQENKLDEEWQIQASPAATESINPIRELLESLTVVSLKGKEKISLAQGDPTAFGHLKVPEFSCRGNGRLQQRAICSMGIPTPEALMNAASMIPVQKVHQVASLDLALHLRMTHVLIMLWSSFLLFLMRKPWGIPC